METIFDTAVKPVIARVYESPRLGRMRRARNDFARKTVRLLSDHSDIVHIGEDTLANHYLKQFGIDPADLFVCQILLSTLPVTVMAVPSRIWRKPERMARMLRAKRRLGGHGRHSIVVPQNAIQNNIASLVSVLQRGSASPTSTCDCGAYHDAEGCAVLRDAANRSNAQRV